MRNSIRLVTQPSTFFSQLQWSSRHWLILAAFLGIAAVETHTGSQQTVNLQFAQLLELKLGISREAAMWLFTAVRLALVVVGSAVVGLSVWLVGNLFGRRTSQRVLFRRLSVVFTVFLASYTLNHLAFYSPALPWVSLVMAAWGLMLGYFAIREQFGLSTNEAAVIGLFALFMVVSTWHFSNHFVEKTLHQQIEEVARQHDLRARKAR